MRNELILPERLCPNDLTALIAPASPPIGPQAIDQAVGVLEQMGFRVKVAKHARARNGFLAGGDRERAGDLMRAFSDRKVKAVFCVRGGYGTARLLPSLDYAVIRKNPKIFVGYSDITSLHCAFLVRAGLKSFHGPMAASDFIKEDFADFSRESWRRTLMEPEPPGSILRGYDGKTVSVLRGGRAEGRLIGGNLSILCTTLGTPYQPSFRNQILFWEDVGEAPYRIDRLLTHLLNAGLLQQVAGAAIGICKSCEDPKAKETTEYRQTLEDVLRERLLPLKIPVVMGFPFGHVPHNVTLPIGGRAILDGKSGDLTLVEPAVR